MSNENLPSREHEPSINRPVRVALSCMDDEHREQVQRLAAHHGLVLSEAMLDVDYHLLVEGDRISLRQLDGSHKPLYVEWVAGKIGYRSRHDLSLKQPLARAIGITHKDKPAILDATAGFGRDAWMLAALGCQVQMLERSPIMAVLLANGLQRAHASAAVTIAERLQLRCADAILYLKERAAQESWAEVVYLDPMYPHSAKSALPTKEMQLLRRLLGEDLDSSALLDAAMAYARRRVVVKRPRHGACIAGEEPDFAINSPNTRYDVYVIKR
jgi:16S rRNA (guanine1516-N2)-methyltransferase